MYDKYKSQNVKAHLVCVLGHEDEEEVWRQCCNDAAVWEPFPPWAGVQGLWAPLHLLLTTALRWWHCDGLWLADEEAEAERGGLSPGPGYSARQRLTCLSAGLVASWRLPQGNGSVWALCSDSAFLCPSLIEWGQTV